MKSKVVLFFECAGLFIAALAIIYFSGSVEHPYAAVNKSAGSSGSDQRASLKGKFPGRRKRTGKPDSRRKFRNKTKAFKQIADKDRFFGDLSRAYPGFTLFPESGAAKVSLLNMSGKIVHAWNTDAMRARLLENCNLLVIHGTKWGLQQPKWKALRNRITEYDWDGNVVWTYTAPDVVHHDVRRFPNGNTLFLQRILVPQVVKDKIKDKNKRFSAIRTDVIKEITRSGDIVWEWHTYDEFDPNSCGGRECPEVKQVTRGDKTIDWTHTNTISPIPENKWYDSGDRRFKPGNLVILPRNFWTVMILDRDTGKIVWRYRGKYKGGISGGHEAQIIPKGLPGAGNLLLFDNGRDKGTSFVLEVNPVTEELVWVYDAGDKFFSQAAGSVQRLPNGNTLVSEDVSGRVFEVTRDKEIVWQYRGDFRSARAHRYEKDYCPRLAALELK